MSQSAPASPTHRVTLTVSDALVRAIAFYRAGRLEFAEALCTIIVRQRPDHFDALHLLAVVQSARRRPQAALACYDRALRLDPCHAEALYNRGVTLRDLGRIEEAVASYDRALAVRPAFPAALVNRGMALYRLGRFEEAVASCDRALAIRPDSVEALGHRGHALQELGRHEEAVASYDRALAIRPDQAELLYSRANARHELHHYEAALADYDRALSLRSDYPEALNNRGLALWGLKRFDEALASYDLAVAIRPGYVEALGNRGMALWALKRFEPALESCNAALAIDPDHAELLGNRGLVLQDLNRHDAAAADFARLMRVAPRFSYAGGLLLHARMQCCDWGSFADDVERLTADVRAGHHACGPFPLLGVSADPAEQLVCARTWVRDKCPMSPAPIAAGGRYSHARIRVAYLSADFRDHPMAYLMAGVFERHDRERFETVALSFGPDRPGEMRTRLKAAFERFIDVRQESDRTVARRLHELEIDIAVDLMGFTQGARTGILAMRPAPVVVNHLGYPGTMGADYVDYIIADRFVIPERSERFYAEKVVRLPDTFQPPDRTRRIDPTTPTRSDIGLPEPGFVFCCFNNSHKITPPLFDVWMRLLRAVEGSVLWLVGASEAVERNLRREAVQRGVAADRLIFAPRVPYAQYLARYRLADLFLDTLPFNAGATASDALSAGLPLVTVAGEAFAARMAGSLLHAAGLPELVTHALADYEALALRLARDADLLAGIRARLANNRATCALFDTDRYRRHLEAAYVTMWQRAERGEPRAAFAVEPLP